MPKGSTAYTSAGKKFSLGAMLTSMSEGRNPIFKRSTLRSLIISVIFGSKPSRKLHSEDNSRSG